MAGHAIPRLASLDFLRLIAALSVVAFHYFFRGAAGGAPLMPVANPFLAPYAIYGYLGVNLFFLISGYVIAWSAEGRPAVEFGIARLVRIYPGFVICMTISFVVLWLAESPALPVTLSQYFANLTIFAPALGQPFVDGVYWSIVLELVFYGWVALAVMTGIFKSWRLEFVAAMLIISAINEGFIGSSALRMLFVTEFTPLFAMGMIAQIIHSRGVSPDAVTLAFAAFVLSFANVTITRDWMAAHYGVALSNDALFVANSVVVGLFLAALAVGASLRSSTATLAIGGLTYPLYLLHQNIGYVTIPYLEPALGSAGSVLVTMAMITLISWLVWRLFERPAQPALKRLLNRIATMARPYPRRIEGPA